MSKLKQVEWIWNHGKVLSKLLYENNNVDLRKNDDPPPTKAAHDIAHFICGFNENFEWDYQIEPNHIAEYNAVFVEELLGLFSFYYYNDYPIDIKIISEEIDSHMKWFSEKHYKIHENHPTKKYHTDLKKDFFNRIDMKILEKYFLQFYQTWIIEDLIGSQSFDISITMNSSIDYEFELLYDYLVQVKQNMIKTKL
jgi:hypothetical protein